jgi:hypothetical protein
MIAQDLSGSALQVAVAGQVGGASDGQQGSRVRQMGG